MQKATPAAPASPAAPAAADASALALLSDLVTSSHASRLSLPPAVAARLRWLLERQDAGKPLTAAERAEAQGLLDIAEYFVVQRLRQRLAA
jgi:L-amino acid N-acyltransferase YncA